MSNKRRRIGKPWWNEDLSVVWNEVCLKGSLWVKCKEPNLKQTYKVGYVQKGKEFDRYKRQNDYIGLKCSQNYKKTWKMIQKNFGRQ